MASLVLFTVPKPNGSKGRGSVKGSGRTVIAKLNALTHWDFYNLTFGDYTMSKTLEKEAKSGKERKPVLTFKLRRNAGPHYEKNLDFDPTEPEDDEDNPREVEFAPGKTIKSRRRLDKIFPNKFLLVDGEVRPSQGVGGDVDDEENDVDKDRPVRSKEHALTRQADRYLDEDELDDGEEGPSKDKLRKLARGERRKTKAMETHKKLGEDVTDNFAGARDADFVVYEKDGKFSIADGDEPTKPLKKGLKRAKVAKALQQLQKE
jgi:hypothetical protein